jgi:MoaA/NifB/PqqE/SkfB family radical SAM enzyme
MITEKIDRITGITPEYSKEVCPAPKSVKIELSPRCNLRCKFCALRTRESQPKDDMDFELFKRITTEMREAGVEEIGCFYLGESFSNYELLVKAIRWCKRLEFPYVFLTSNATLAHPYRVEAVMKAGLDSLKWSVNAADSEQYKEIMGVKSSLFEVALKNIKQAYEIRELHGFDTKLYASSIKYDDDQSEKMEKLIEARVKPYVDQHYELPLYGMAMRSEAVREAIGYTPTHGNAGRIDPITGLPNRAPLPCWSVSMEGHVRHDGHMSACCFGANDTFDVGDLNDNSFMDVWNSESMRSIRRAQQKTKADGPAALKGTMCEVCVAY